jgi:hypothetical protein
MGDKKSNDYDSSMQIQKINESSSSILSNMNKDKLERYFSNTTYDSCEFVDSDRFNSLEIDEICGVLKEGFKTHLKTVDEDFPIHITWFLIRAAKVSTSERTTYKYSYSYEIKGMKYVVQDSWIFPTVKSATKKFGRQNSVRVFCSTFSEYYLVVAAKLDPAVFTGRCFARKGLPAKREYLGADFVNGNESVLEDRERAMSIVATENTLKRASFNLAEKSLISLYDL